MLLIIYLIGVIIAVYLIGKAISVHPENDVEFNGFIIGYCFALASWLTVLVILTLKADDRIKQRYNARLPKP